MSTKWKVGDRCLIHFGDGWRVFVIYTAGTQGAQLQAAFKNPDERITPRTIRSYEKMRPVPEPTQPENNMVIVKTAVLCILVFSIVGLVMYTLWPHRKGK